MNARCALVDKRGSRAMASVCNEPERGLGCKGKRDQNDGGKGKGTKGGSEMMDWFSLRAVPRPVRAPMRG